MTRRKVETLEIEFNEDLIRSLTACYAMYYSRRKYSKEYNYMEIDYYDLKMRFPVSAALRALIVERFKEKAEKILDPWAAAPCYIAEELAVLVLAYYADFNTAKKLVHADRSVYEELAQYLRKIILPKIESVLMEKFAEKLREATSRLY